MITFAFSFASYLSGALVYNLVDDIHLALFNKDVSGVPESKEGYHSLKEDYLISVHNDIAISSSLLDTQKEAIKDGVYLDTGAKRINDLLDVQRHYYSANYDVLSSEDYKFLSDKVKEDSYFVSAINGHLNTSYDVSEISTRLVNSKHYTDEEENLHLTLVSVSGDFIRHLIDPSAWLGIAYNTPSEYVSYMTELLERFEEAKTSFENSTK
jgi:hypothetical protein